MTEPWIADRYETLTLLGRGGSGVVYRATDHVTGELVALKFLRGLDGHALHRLRRELASLRWLRMPGVVRLRDEGPWRDDWFIAMDLVQGDPFPGSPSPLPWAALRSPTLALLRLLARVHAAGVVHRDLKPVNVLVCEGQPTLLDFGVSRGEALARGASAREYTPQFAAPEQLRGEREDHRTDLFAVGRMLQRSLDPSDAPPELLALLRRMLSARRSRRPSAAEVLAALDDAPPPPARPPATSAAELEPLFHGPDLFHHLREDAAKLLFSRTDGDPSRVKRELRRWVDSGHAREEDDRLRVDRVGIEALSSEESDRAITRQILAGKQPRRMLKRVRALAAERAEQGQHERAMATLDLGLALARGARADEGPLLADWTRLALARESLPALDRALYTLERADHSDPALLALLRGSQAAFRGEGARALALLDGIDALADEELEGYRQGHRVRAAASLGLAEEEALLQALEGWARGLPHRVARLDGWRGNLRYRQNRFEEAAALHLRRAASTGSPVRRLSARLDAAMALLEQPDLAAAEALARQSVAEAARLRHVVYEGYATVYLRIAEYRAGRPLSARPELVQAALPLRAHLAALHALTEAAIAWRSGDLPLTIGLARQAESLFASQRHHEPALLCAALAFAAGDAEDPARLLQEDWRVPDFGVQVAGLLALGGARVDAARIRAAARPASQWAARLDVLSIDEALDAIKAVQNVPIV